MKKQTFVIEVTETEHQSWQGSIQWIQGQDTKQFRSMMEMLRLLDSVVGSESEKESVRFAASGRDEL